VIRTGRRPAGNGASKTTLALDPECKASLRDLTVPEPEDDIFKMSSRTYLRPFSISL
jgi:hypothetical protein